ncbi:MAG: arabinose-5-phosphate isomerase [Saprospiraceae bacterium]
MKENKQILSIAKKVIDIETDSLLKAAQRLDQNFIESVHLIANCKGRIIVTGIGKSAAIANKIVATFNSTGTPSIFMHAAEALHGDLGLLLNDDIVLCISNSGNSPEIKSLVPFIQSRKNCIIAIVGDKRSFLAQNADHVIDAQVDTEACDLVEVPTSSTTVQLALGDALAVCLMEIRGFSNEDFAKSHPGGSLGKKLSLQVKQLMNENQKASVLTDSPLEKVIFEISSKRMGATAVMDKENLVGMITDGDIRRMLQDNSKLDDVVAKDIMSASPKTINENELAIEALAVLKQSNISQIIVIDDTDNYVGIIHFHDLIKEGL